MKRIGIALGVWFALGTAPSIAADIGIVTLHEGSARVLRGFAWHKVAEGIRVEETDIVEVGERAQVQVELNAGGILNVVGPGAIYFSSVPSRDAKVAGPADILVTQGWLKLVAKPPGLRLRTPQLQVISSDAIMVVRCSSDSTEVFIETGQAKLAEIVKNSPSASAREAKADEFWLRTTGKPPTSQRVAPSTFTSAMPRHFTDPLPNRIAKFQAARVPLVAETDITYSEAVYWLSGPYRKLFVRRLQPLLKDVAFRQEVDANIRLYPEWDRILHPEKYVDEYGRPK